MPERIFHFGLDQDPKPMQETRFGLESDLQELLAAHPELLDGERMRPGEPLRWMLISREMGIADAPNAANRWSVDHLLVDQDGLPTLVEVKRGQDTRIRREVVGQMLDYAAHAAGTWSKESIEQALEDGGRRAERERDLLDPEGQLDDETLSSAADAFWTKVQDNLKAEKLRLVFVADAIPDELAHVVEFLNRQMSIEVLAVELKQFKELTASPNRTIVPRVIGRLAKPRPAGGTRTTLTADDFLERLDKIPREAAQRLLDTAYAHNGSHSGGGKLAIKVSCPAWRNPISVAWLTPVGHPDSRPQAANHFLFGIIQVKHIEKMPQALRDRLRCWASLFEGRPMFVPVADPWSAENANDYGFIPCHAVLHSDAANDIDFLTTELASVLDDIANINA